MQRSLLNVRSGTLPRVSHVTSRCFGLEGSAQPSGYVRQRVLPSEFEDLAVGVSLQTQNGGETAVSSKYIGGSHKHGR